MRGRILERSQPTAKLVTSGIIKVEVYKFIKEFTLE